MKLREMSLTALRKLAGEAGIKGMSKAPRGLVMDGLQSKAGRQAHARLAGAAGKSAEPMDNDLRIRHYNWTNLVHRGVKMNEIFGGQNTPRQARRIRKAENRAKGRP